MPPAIVHAFLINTFAGMRSFLVIQTAFIGDVVLSTAVVEKLKQHFPDAGIDFLVRKGNQGLLENNPHLRRVLVWDKKKDKLKNLFRLLGEIRQSKYDTVITLQRYFSTGMLTAFSGAKEKIGFDKNPLSFLFTRKVPHHFDPANPRHEVDRNNDLIRHITDERFIRPALYPSPADEEKILPYCQKPFITISPSSVWYTKKFPIEKWISCINRFPAGYQLYFLGGPENVGECEELKKQTSYPGIEILAGKLSFLQSAALMKKASMNFVNDSGPLHFCSAVNAPVTAIFCSTAPVLGYTPLSDDSAIVETREKLACRPCGWHGHQQCPEKHFRCATGINENDILARIPAIT